MILILDDFDLIPHGSQEKNVVFKKLPSLQVVFKTKFIFNLSSFFILLIGKIFLKFVSAIEKLKVSPSLFNFTLNSFKQIYND